MKTDLKNKTIWITGAASGLGYSLCRKLAAEEGTSFLLIDKDAAGLKETVKLLHKNSRKSHELIVDLRSTEELDLAFLDLPERYESPDLLICCAGYEENGLAENVPIKNFYDSINVNLVSSFFLAKKVIPVFKYKKKGTMVFVTSGMGRRGAPGKSAYCAPKFALHGFAESLRLEMLPHGVNVITVSPGPMRTGFENRCIHHGQNPFYYGIKKKGVSPDKVADRIVRAIKSGRKRLTLFSVAELFMLVNKLAPSIADSLMFKMTYKPNRKDTK